jgi:hypothetical protein
MAFVPKCDKCNKLYENGYQGFFKKSINAGSKLKPMDFMVEIKIHPPHLCNPCFKKLMKETIKGGL